MTFEFYNRSRILVAVCHAVETLRKGEKLEDSHPAAWVSAFTDPDDQNDMLAELFKAAATAGDGESSWDDFDAVVHEWEETAAVIREGLLATAMQEPADPVPLRTVLDREVAAAVAYYDEECRKCGKGKDCAADCMVGLRKGKGDKPNALAGKETKGEDKP